MSTTDITTATAHRTAPASLRSRAAVAAVALGAVVAGGLAGLSSAAPLADSDEAVTFAANSADIAAFATSEADSAATVQVLGVTSTADAGSIAQQLAKGKQFSDERAAREAALRRSLFSLPTNGILTSGFGERWGSMHTGLDIAAPMGTPIYAAADGVVLEAGPAAGFGLWIKIQHEDGTVTIYGHNDTNIAVTGQKVRAGEQIATVGTRGFSTGPHVHFEVWINGVDKIDPIGWYAAKGISVTGDMG